MTTKIVTLICSALIGLAALSSQTYARQKTVKACEDEWRANRAENQAKGITEKAYVAQCRAADATQILLPPGLPQQIRPVQRPRPRLAQ